MYSGDELYGDDVTSPSDEDRAERLRELDEMRRPARQAAIEEHRLRERARHDLEEDARADRTEQSPAYRGAMRDAGRGSLLR